jgi:hypothetical protein
VYLRFITTFYNDAGTVEDGEGHDVANVSAETDTLEEEGDDSIEAGTVEEGGEEESVDSASLGDEEDDCDNGSQVIPPEDAVSPVLINVVNVEDAAAQASHDVYPSKSVAFKLYKQFEKVDPKLIMGNTEEDALQTSTGSLK